MRIKVEQGLQTEDGFFTKDIVGKLAKHLRIYIYNDQKEYGFIVDMEHPNFGKNLAEFLNHGIKQIQD